MGRPANRGRQSGIISRMRFLISLIMVIIFASAAKRIIGILLSELNKTEKEPQPQPKPRRTPTTPTKEDFDRVANLCHIPPDPDGFHGWRTIRTDTGGTPSDRWDVIAEQGATNMESLRKTGRMHGRPGGGLTMTGFGTDREQSGRSGEERLAQILAGSDLPILTYWSLSGLDEDGLPVDADIDCVILGVDRRDHVRAWFVDAKNYKGTNDTAYINLNEDSIARVSICGRAFVNGGDGTPYMMLSGNMAWQRANWARVLERRGIVSEWLICAVPHAGKEAPNMGGAVWPGGIRAVTPEVLVSMLRSQLKEGPCRIPLDTLDLFRQQLKAQSEGDERPGADVNAAPLTAVPSMPVRKPPVASTTDGGAVPAPALPPRPGPALPPRPVAPALPPRMPSGGSGEHTR